MQPFVRVAGVAAPLDMPNVDTDQIIPARFLKRSKDDPEFGTFLFRDLRLDGDGKERPGFVLNKPEYRGAVALVADRNFGCGSSREAAVYALMAGGFRTVIAPSFGDIFYNNSFKNGFLPIRLAPEVCAGLRRALVEHPGAEIAIDLEAQTVSAPDQTVHRFEVDPFLKLRMLKGLDDIDFTLEYGSDISKFEENYRKDAPWL